MKGLLHILRYLFYSQILLVGSAVCGLGAMALVLLFILWDQPRAAFTYAEIAYLLMLVLPALVSPAALRNLLGSRRLLLVPRLPLRTGIGLLVLGLLTAVWLPFFRELLLPEPLQSPFLGIRIFFYYSLYLLFMQFALGSRFFALYMAFGPFVMVLTMSRLGAELQQLFTESLPNMLLFACCAAGWAIALYRLAAGRRYRQALRSSDNTVHGYMWGLSAALLARNNQGAGLSRSPAGTLVLSYPDGLRSRLLQLLIQCVVFPVLGITLVAVIHPGEAVIDHFFMVFSLVMLIYTAYSNGELAARSRLVWLRQGGGRQQMWQLLERLVLGNLLLGMLIACCIAMVMLQFTTSPRFTPVNFLVAALSSSTLAAYLSLLARIYDWPAMLRMLLFSLLGPLLALTFLQDTIPPMLVAAALVVLALLSRGVATARYARIDWSVISCRRSTIESALA